MTKACSFTGVVASAAVVFVLLSWRLMQGDPSRLTLAAWAICSGILALEGFAWVIAVLLAFARCE
jgi:hypothetical protein